MFVSPCYAKALARWRFKQQAKALSAAIAPRLAFPQHHTALPSPTVALQYLFPGTAQPSTVYTSPAFSLYHSLPMAQDLCSLSLYLFHLHSLPPVQCSLSHHLCILLSVCLPLSLPCPPPFSARAFTLKVFKSPATEAYTCAHMHQCTLT